MIISCHDIVAILAALAAAFLGYWLVPWAMANLAGGTTIDKKTAASLGALERVMYVGAWFLGFLKFIAVWLGVKVVGEWGKRSSSDSPGQFSRFLFGSGLSLVIAVFIALLAERLISSSWYEPLCSFTWLPRVLNSRG